MNDDIGQLLNSLSSEEVEQLMGLGSLDEQDSMLERQMQLADAMRQQPATNYSTPTGAALGSVAQAIRGIGGAIQTKKLQQQRDKLLGEKKSGRSLFAQMLRGKPKFGSDFTPPPLIEAASQEEQWKPYMSPPPMIEAGPAPMPSEDEWANYPTQASSGASLLSSRMGQRKTSKLLGLKNLVRPEPFGGE